MAQAGSDAVPEPAIYLHVTACPVDFLFRDVAEGVFLLTRVVQKPAPSCSTTPDRRADYSAACPDRCTPCLHEDCGSNPAGGATITTVTLRGYGFLLTYFRL